MRVTLPGAGEQRVQKKQIRLFPVAQLLAHDLLGEGQALGADDRLPALGRREAVDLPLVLPAERADTGADRRQRHVLARDRRTVTCHPDGKGHAAVTDPHPTGPADQLPDPRLQPATERALQPASAAARRRGKPEHLVDALVGQAERVRESRSDDPARYAVRTVRRK